MSETPSTEPVAGAQFVWHTRVFFDDLDPMGMLHNSRYIVLVERTESSFHWSQGRQWELDVSANPDQYYAIREQTIRYLLPVRGNIPISIHMWLGALGRTSATFEFQIRSVQGLHATATRTIVKIDPVTQRSAAWTDTIRHAYSEIAGSREHVTHVDGDRMS